jgi:hypothetical protein
MTRGLRPRSTALAMAHIDLAEGTGGPRPPLGDGSGYLNIQQLPWTVERGLWTAAKLAKIHDHENLITVDRGTCSQQAMSRELQPKNRQDRLVYKRSNFAGKPPFSATFGHARRAFQPPVQAQHVVAVT